ncbi:WD repeat and fyve domain protein, partial [Ichthyophthirius multifiliis]
VKNDINIIVNRKKEFLKSTVLDDWRKGKITNFEFLMQLNSYSGRSTNDLSQYPIFPWVLQDYESSVLNLDDNRNYRQLGTPIGALNRERFEKNYMQRFKGSDPDDKNTYFMYGTHYSNATIVLTFLMRMEPFAGLHFQQQENKFDYADRLFHSVKEQWKSGLNNTADVKELLPEFYYLPDFLYNVNQLYLGKKQDNTDVDKVILPQWIQKSTNSPEFKIKENYISFIKMQNENYIMNIQLILDNEVNGLQWLAKCSVGCALIRETIVNLNINYLIKYEKMTVLEALDYIRTKREIVQPNIGFMNQLRKYYESLYN